MRYEFGKREKCGMCYSRLIANLDCVESASKCMGSSVT